MPGVTQAPSADRAPGARQFGLRPGLGRQQGADQGLLPRGGAFGDGVIVRYPRDDCGVGRRGGLQQRPGEDGGSARATGWANWLS